MSRRGPVPRLDDSAAHSAASGAASLAYSERGNRATAASRSLLVSSMLVLCSL